LGWSDVVNRRDRRAAKTTQQWLPLQRASLVPKTPAQIDAAMAHISSVAPHLDVDAVRALVERSGDEISESWRNDRYHVHVIRWPALRLNGHLASIAPLSIRRNDRAPCRDWRDMQRIKNQLVGPECEAIELYPAESRLVDTANQFHLWCVEDPYFRFPFGWESGRMIVSDSGGGAIQRPIED
jgi:hypothetical protein